MSRFFGVPSTTAGFLLDGVGLVTSEAVSYVGAVWLERRWRARHGWPIDDEEECW